MFGNILKVRPILPDMNLFSLDVPTGSHFYLAFPFHGQTSFQLLCTNFRLSFCTQLIEILGINFGNCKHTMIMIITHCGQQSEKSSFHAKINYADFVHFFATKPTNQSWSKIRAALIGLYLKVKTMKSREGKITGQCLLCG